MILSYALRSALILCCGYLCYRWVMADERQHSYNRVMLYLIYAASFVLPLVALSGMINSSANEISGAMVEIGKLSPVGMKPQINGSGQWINYLVVARVLVIVYFVGVMWMLLASMSGMLSLWRVIKSGKRISAGRYVVVITNESNIAPFSWMRYIVLASKDYALNGEVIMKHECSHLCRRHWVDLLIAQVVICLQWFNPAAWLLREELRTVHEYQADEAVLNSGTDITGYQRMLITKAVGSRFQSFANSLNHSKLKKRVTMMYKEKSSAARRISALLLAPALAAGCFATAIPSVARVLDSFAEVSFANDSENKITKNLRTEKIEERRFTVSDQIADNIAETSNDIRNNPEETTDLNRSADSGSSMKEIENVSLTADPSAEKEGDVYTVADKCAEFPGGMPALFSYLQDSIKYPEDAIDNREEGLVVVRFIVEADGSIKSAEIVKSVTPTLDSEALRVVKSMPKWHPGKNKGKAVATWFTLPVSFKLPPEEEKGEK
ncbi:MAG: M56 family metallopeptidase [Muribaculaceae bacterium]|nr:M56 family metallopeptidase [Muribaculaceae bacterium]